MNIMILGSGGRECTLAWKCRQSPLCNQLFIAPGNAGTHDYGINLSINIQDFTEIKNAVLAHDIRLVIVGPEAPLVNGLTDFFRGDKELSEVTIIGPSREAAALEGSKSFAKKFMEEYHIPTAKYGEYTLANLEEGIQHLSDSQGPYVLKADGLAAGKGVVIHTDAEKAKTELKQMLDGKFGAASHRVVIEEFLDGIEFSVFVLTDGENYVLLPEAKDYKRIGENDTGLNTGGMGAVSPVPFFDEELKSKVIHQIIEPTVNGIQKRGMDYVGFIFFGLIKVNEEPKVIEYNVRLGDPETEVILPRLNADLVELLSLAGKKKLKKVDLDFTDQFATTVMTVSGGYPGSYEKGKVITGLDTITQGLLFHAGTTMNEKDEIITNGGRVLALTSFGDTLEEALRETLENAEKVNFSGKYYRKDIGFDLKGKE